MRAIRPGQAVRRKTNDREASLDDIERPLTVSLAPEAFQAGRLRVRRCHGWLKVEVLGEQPGHEVEGELLDHQAGAALMDWFSRN